MPSLRYLGRRLLFAALLVFVVSSAALLLTCLAPGDYATEVLGFGASPERMARTRTQYGLDRPPLTQYGDWLRRTPRLDFGTSLLYGRPVGELIRSRAINTALLALAALTLATLIGLPLGVFTGSRPSGALSTIVRGASLLGLSVPPLLTSLLLVLIAARTGWLPIGGMTSAALADEHWIARVVDIGRHLPLPALALALPIAALVERLQSQAMAEAMRQSYMMSALGRGVPRSRLIWRDGLRAASGPVVSMYGLIVGSLFSGSFVVEIVTAWPGLGRLMFDALRARDVFLVAGCAGAGALFLAAGNLLSDLALAMVDPRVRETS